MDIIKEISDKTVSISEFNRGQAGRIFDEVKNSGPKVVLKNNTPEAVVMSPDQYSRLLSQVSTSDLLFYDHLTDDELAAEIKKGLDDVENGNVRPLEEVLKDLNSKFGFEKINKKYDL